MSEDTKELEANARARQFIKDKGFTDSFVQEEVESFIVEHDKKYGHIVSLDELMNRLYENVDEIIFDGQHISTNGELGRYEGRVDDDEDKNTITLYSDKKSMELSDYDKQHWEIYTEKDKKELSKKVEQTREDVKDTLKHELTHAAYSIKGKYGIGEEHIFDKYGKNLFGGQYYSHIGGKDYYVEGVVNYISSSLSGKSPDELITHKYETKAIGLLAEKIGIEKFIRSVWESNEEMLLKAYIESEKEPEEIARQNFFEVDECIKKLSSLYEYEKDYLKYNQRSSEVIDNMQNILEGRKKEEIASSEPEKKTDEKSEDENAHNSEEIKEGQKSGLEDVLEAGIKRSLFDRATQFVKVKLINIKDKIIGAKEDRDD